MQKAFIDHDRLVNNFLELVKIDSPSGHESEIVQEVSARFHRMGVPTQQDSVGNIIALLEGEGEPIIYSAHLDTVEPGRNIKPTISGNIISSGGDTILGADNKDAVVAILETIYVIQKYSLSRRCLEIVFTIGEEHISAGAKHLDYSLLRSKRAIIFDGVYGVGNIIISAPYCSRFEIIIKGKKAHAARPEQGINAIKAACLAINQLPVGRVNEMTASNIAFIKGGIVGSADNQEVILVDESRHNSVPDYVKLGGEVRGLDRNAFESTLKKFEVGFRATADEFGADCSFVQSQLANGYVHSKDDDWVQEIAQGFENIGIKPKFIDSLGGSDANIFNLHSIKAVDVGATHQKSHSTDEFIIIDDLIRLTEFLLSFALI